MTPDSGSNVAADALPCRIYDSAVPARYLLELPARTAQALGLHPADRFVLADSVKYRE